MRILCAGLALWLLPAVAAAQDVLPSASLQMGLPSAALARRPPAGSIRRDLFRADPATFAPTFHEPPLLDSRFVPCCGGFAGPVFAPAGTWWAPQPQIVYVPYVIIEREVPRAAPAPPPAAAPPPPPPAPGVPKTFYVIPGCYAGDKRPDAGALPRGCDIGRLRTIPPR